ncbi:signal peptidase II [Metallococcus carri]|uniref:signal peptidase II n=1 Tax=Metallococcus carri TaxID=1656884 RepID=UPI001A9F18A2|nr:signal peptidase II [Metallococcus carri]
MSTAVPVVRRSALALLAGVLVLGYAADQLVKAWAVAALEPGQPRELIGSVLRLHLTRNPGAAFSIATNATWVLTIIAIVVIGATLYVARRLRSRAWACALGLLLAGALGNLTDRFFRAPGGGKGHVVDMLELPNWPIFNVADICVVTAACLIALLAFRGIGVDGTRASGDDAKATEPAGATADGIRPEKSGG